jgi:hypothetical protein
VEGGQVISFGGQNDWKYRSMSRINGNGSVFEASEFDRKLLVFQRLPQERTKLLVFPVT